MNQKTLVLVKPDGVERGLVGEIVSRFEKAGLKIVHLEGPVKVDPQLAADHYQLNNYDYVLTLGHVDVTGKTDEEKEQIHQKNSKIIQNLQDFLTVGEVFKMVLEGEDAILKVRGLVGKTDPAASPEGSIRGDFGDDSFAKADEEGRSVRNIIHASGAPDEAEREIKLWFGE